MKRYTIHSLLTACLMTLVTGLALVSCSQDDAPDTPALVPEGDDVTVTLKLSTRALHSDSDYAAADDTELIKKWLVIATEVNPDGSPGKYVDHASDEQKDADRQAEVSLKLSAPANYYFFAFANWGDDFSEEEIEDIWNNLTEESMAERLEALNARFGTSSSEKTESQDNVYVPMSGIKCVQVTRHVNQQYAIEVVRMLAKIRFEFRNSSDHSITVNSVKLSPYSDNGSLHRFPRYDDLTEEPHKLTWDYHQDEVLITSGAKDFAKNETSVWPMNIQLTTEDKDKDYSDDNTFTRYMREIEAEPIWKSENVELPKLFRLDFNVSRGGSTGDNVYTYMADDFTYVNRNDYVILPIRFTDWKIEFDVRSYPPIGGYPAKKEEDNDAAFVGVFYNPGRFEIIPRVYHYNGSGMELISSDKLTFTVDSPEPKNILESDVKTTDSNEIIGDIKTGNTYDYDLIEFRLTGVEGFQSGQLPPMKRIYIVRDKE